MQVLQAPRANFAHEGVFYRQLLALLGAELRPRTYFEIGTRAGESMKQFDADTICVDPEFTIKGEVILRRRRTFFFQMPSDEFLAQYDITDLFGGPFDIAFLDGMHLFEYLLRDFIATERHAGARSLIVLHDCLPPHPAITGRDEAAGREPEPEPGAWSELPEAPKGAWTGDVYRMLFALAAYRPDLRVHAFDCPPTGLVVVSRLDPSSTALQEAYYEIVDTIGRIPLGVDRLRELWSLYPLVDSRHVADHPGELSRLYPAFR